MIVKKIEYSWIKGDGDISKINGTKDNLNTIILNLILFYYHHLKLHKVIYNYKILKIRKKESLNQTIVCVNTKTKWQFIKHAS